MIKLIMAILMLSSMALADGNPEDNRCKAQVVTKIVYRDRIVEKEVVKYKTRKNRLFLLVGNGPSDSLSTSNTVNGVQVESGDENFVGLGYLRDLGRFNLGLQYQSNENVAVSFGLNW